MSNQSTSAASASAATSTKLQVLLAAFRPNESAMVPSEFEWVPVASLEEASEKVEEFIAENDCGGRDWFGGIVRDEIKMPVAVIGYTGNIETVGENETFINNAMELLTK